MQVCISLIQLGYKLEFCEENNLFFNEMLH